MKTKLLRSILCLIALSLVMGACERDERFSQGSNEEEEQTLESASVSEDASDDALEMVAQAESELTTHAAGGRLAALCAYVTKNAEQKTVTIDFGEGCVGPYGRERKGKIIVSYSGTVGDSLANRIITFDNYFVNDKKVEGAIEVGDININDEGNLQSTKKLLDLKVSFVNGEHVVFNGTRTRELISGYGDGDRFNNIYKITGSVSGVSATGRSFTHEITTPVIADWSCAAQGSFARVSGVVEMTALGGYMARKRIVDYGTGDCDHLITITTYRRTYQVTVGG